MTALIQVYLRALGLVGQSVAIGGAVLGLLVLRPWLALVALTAAGTVSAAWISHAAGRLARGPLILTLDAVHQLAAGLWVGGLAHLLVLAWARASRPWPAETLQRFSRLAQGAVATLAAAAIGLWLLYIGGPGAALGTAYGAMTLTKGVLFLGLLGLGALNFFAVRRLRRDAGVPPLTLRRLVGG